MRVYGGTGKAGQSHPVRGVNGVIGHVNKTIGAEAWMTRDSLGAALKPVGVHPVRNIEKKHLLRRDGAHIRNQPDPAGTFNEKEFLAITGDGTHAVGRLKRHARKCIR